MVLSLFGHAKWKKGDFGVVPKKTPHRRNRALPPLVKVRGDRVEGALLAADLPSRRGAARRLNALLKPSRRITSQTLDWIVTGQQESCRTDLLEAIGRLTGLPCEWLTGTWEYLGYVAPWQELAGHRGISHFKVRPAEAYVRLWRFVKRCVDAVERDLMEEFPDLSAREPLWPGVRNRAAQFFESIASPEHFMVRLVGWDGLGRPEGLDDESATQGRLVIGLVESWQYELAPWLRGERPLNYGYLANLCAPHPLTSPNRQALPSRLLGGM